MDNCDWQELTSQCVELIAAQQTLLLSTVSVEGKPESSYAPYVRDQAGIYYIFVSELATHTRNMLQNSLASVLFIQAEKETQNPFARKRAVFACKVCEVKRDEALYGLQLELMEQRFGETVALLSRLPDFHLLSLEPVSGKYIAGFGQAFTIDLTEGTLRLSKN